MISKIFDIFARADKDIARTEGGLGVGLTLAKKLARLHGGDIRTASEGLGLGQGSEFTITIPMEERKKMQAEEKDRVPKAQSETLQKKVLVVDDNQNLTEALGSVLRRFGHTVSEPQSGEARKEYGSSSISL